MQLQVGANELDEGQKELLQHVIFYSETGDEPATSRVHQAADQGCGMGEALEQDGWAINLLDNIGWAPLHWAAHCRTVDAVQQLIDAGADVDIETVGGRTPLMFAAQHNDIDCVRRLLDAGCRTDRADIDGSTSLHVAAAYGAVDVVRMLLSPAQKGGAQTIAAIPSRLNSRLPLHELAYSLEKGATLEAIEEIATLLLDAHPSAIETRSQDGVTPAMIAIFKDNLPLLRCLVREGASLTAIDPFHQNVLHDAARYSSVPTIDFLLQQSITRHQLHITDHRISDEWGDSSWDDIIFYMHAPPWELSPSRHASRSICAAFLRLYRHIRDSNLRYDISTIQEAFSALQGGHTTFACSLLYGLAKHQADGYNDDGAAWYRAFAKQVNAGEIEGAAIGLEQDLKELRDELQSPPWEQESCYDYMASESQWVEVSRMSFWIEPAEAFMIEEVREGLDKGEEQQQQYPDHNQDDRWVILSGRSLHTDLITHIYSDRGHLLYDHETDRSDPRECLRQYERDFDHGEAT